MTLFLRLDEKNLRRTKAFVKLSLDYDVDVGFVVCAHGHNYIIPCIQS